MAKAKSRRFQKELPLIRQIFKVTPYVVINHPSLISKLDVNLVSTEFMKILSSKLSTFEDFQNIFIYLSKHRLDSYYILVYVLFLCKYDYGLFLLEKFNVLKGLRLLEMRMEIPQKINWSCHNLAHNYYNIIQLNYCNYYYNSIMYVNPDMLTLYDYFTIARFCCENDPNNFRFVNVRAFGNATIKYYLALALYLELIYSIKIDVAIPQLKDDIDLFPDFMPVLFNSVSLTYPSFHYSNNLTIALAQSFGKPCQVPQDLPKTKVFKFSDVSLDSNDVNIIVEFISNYLNPNQSRPFTNSFRIE
jgi:hypothetical protein